MHKQKIKAMSNGKSKELTATQKSKIFSEFNKTRVKSDLEFKYNIKIPTIIRVLKTGRCSERIFNVLFKKL